MNNDRKSENKIIKQPKVHHALIIFGVLIIVMSVGVLVYDAGVHVSIFIGVIAAALMALYLGFDWLFIEQAMVEGIASALNSIIILLIVGILIGVWITSGVVPAMIYYGLNLLSPSIFLVAVLLICSIASFATGTAWGTISTMGLAFMGISFGLGIPLPMTAGAIVSGAYFGDKMSPLSDTTNLATAMTGVDMFTHLKFMVLPTAVTYLISLLFFAFLSTRYADGKADMSAADDMKEALANTFNISPVLLLPFILVIIVVAMKVRAIPGLTIGIVAGGIVGMLTQGDACSFGSILKVGMEGYVCNSGLESIDTLLTTGGIENMMFSVSLIIVALMFGGIMEKTRLLDVVVAKILMIVKRPVSLIITTELTCILCNCAMPDQYISLVVPGRMYVEPYKAMKLHPKTLSNALESAGTVTSALVPWNTCGVFIMAALGLSPLEFFPYAIFNILTPITTILFAFAGLTVAKADGSRIRGFGII